MKSFVLFLSAAMLASGQNVSKFATGQAARALIGQANFTQQDDNASMTDTAQIGLTNRFVTLMGGAGAVAYGNGTLLVLDGNRIGATPLNNRVLVYHNIDAVLPNPNAELPAGISDRCPVCVGLADAVVGQPDFKNNTVNLSQTGLRTPTGVATDGTRLVVADTDNNRVLIWNTIPTSNNAPANVVLGQPDFVTNRPGLTAKNLRGPEGVWIQGSRLFVADTSNNRVLVWTSIPTTNQQPADYVLGQPNLTTANAPDPRFPETSATASNLYNPVHVSSDGQRLYVTDLGFNRVLIWNTIPTSNGAPANIAIGQLDLNSGYSNNVTRLCASNGTDTSGNATYPNLCSGTLSFPRAAVSDGNRLFIADGGNDRVLVYETIPTTSAKNADEILGQPDEFTDQVTSEDFNPGQSAAADVVRAPNGLAWDPNNNNLYVADPYNRRVVVFSPAVNTLPYGGFRNAFSINIFAIGNLAFAGKATAGNTVAITIGSNTYTYTVTSTDTLTSIVTGVVSLINGQNNNAGDPLVLAIPNTAIEAVLLVARQNGSVGSSISVSTVVQTSSSNTAAGDVVISTTAPAINGQNAAQIAPGSIVTIQTPNAITDTPAMADAILSPSENGLQFSLSGVEVYFDGIRAPIFSVDTNQVTVQVPFELADATNSTAYIRSSNSSGVQTTTAVAVPIVAANPGILAQNGNEPRRAVAFHSSSNAAATVLLTGTLTTGDTATISIEDRTYTYTLVDGDTLDSVRDGLIRLINAKGDEKVFAYAAGIYDRIILKAKIAGPDGNGIVYGATTTGSGNITLSPSSAALCCANQANAPVTPDNPAVAGEQILVYATGLGLIGPNTPEAAFSAATGYKYQGTPNNYPVTTVDDSLVGGSTANVLFSGLQPGLIGVYQVVLELSGSIPTNDLTQLTIAQGLHVSNIVTLPVVNNSPAVSQ